MVNQVTKAVSTKEIPRLVIETSYTNGNNDFVDSIQKIVGPSATIF